MQLLRRQWRAGQAATRSVRPTLTPIDTKATPPVHTGTINEAAELPRRLFYCETPAMLRRLCRLTVSLPRKMFDRRIIPPAKVLHSCGAPERE
jgi:hypothetical protein